MAMAEEHRAVGALQRCHLAVDSQPGALSHGQHRYAVFLAELSEPLSPGLALVGACRVWVEVVRIDLERDEAERVEPFRIQDRHVIGRADGGTGDVGACGGAQVGKSGVYAVGQWAEKPGSASGAQ